MSSFSYHAFFDESSNSYNYCSRSSDELPLLVNCTGRMELSNPFATYNGEGRADYYLLYVISGELSVEASGVRHSCREGSYVIFAPNYKYEYSRAGEVSYSFVHFTGSFAEKLISARLGIDLTYIGYAGLYDEIFSRFDEIFSAFASSDESTRDLRAGASLMLLLEALVRRERVPSELNRLSRSMAYISSNYGSDISVGELAEMESLSVSRYNAIFRQQTSVSPIRYITELRIKHACSLLVSTDIDVGVIGRSVGYEDKHFFSKMFKKYIGMSAVEYRAKNRAGK